MSFFYIAILLVMLIITKYITMQDHLYFKPNNKKKITRLATLPKVWQHLQQTNFRRLRKVRSDKEIDTPVRTFPVLAPGISVPKNTTEVDKCKQRTTSTTEIGN